MSSNSDKNKGIVDEDLIIQSTNNPEPSRGQVNFEANFGRLSLEMLKFLCQGIGISEIGLKQDLVSRLVSECKGREEASSDLFGKGKSMNLDNDVGDTEAFLYARDRGHSVGGPNIDKQEGGDLGARATGVHQSLRFPEAKEKFVFDNDIDETGLWRKRNLSKARNQWEFNEWCKAGLLMDKALNTGDVDYLLMARQVALERAYVVRVADEDGWGVAVKMASNNTVDSISQMFGGKRERARLAVQNVSKSKKFKLAQERSQRVDAQQRDTVNAFPGVHQGQPVTPVFFQAHPSFLPSWQQWPSQHGLVSSPAVMGVNNMDSHMSGQQATQNSVLQNPFLSGGIRV
ncbi:14378_t:CDS:2 [Cetraspora pellucida]|uniref:14378_t:CDS:1 n=1 Tax=Cetraspora pellucida TaxID=1433469 RepID=A0A9N8WB29_9GLOM|nr:14378_t:CDS:2 [Cetraspora pellucida]